MYMGSAANMRYSCITVAYNYTVTGPEKQAPNNYLTARNGGMAVKKLKPYEILLLFAAAVTASAVLWLREVQTGVYTQRGEAEVLYDWQNEDGKMDINAAGVSELELLPGVGPERARAIADYRDRYGEFSTIYELLAVPGIYHELLEEFEEYICVEDSE